jgi:glutamate synthase (NADPH/NADH) small chain
MPDANPLPLKERMKIPHVAMPELEPEVRAHCFAEVNQGLSAESAEEESSRCLACNRPACVGRCPVGVQIREVVALIYAGDFLATATKMREDNALPAITGRVCPHSRL